MASPQPAHRANTLAPILGALAIAVVALVAIFAIGVSNDSGDPNNTVATALAADKALACPAKYLQTGGDTNGWVPRRPHGLNGDDALVPGDTPTHAVVCAYLDGAEPGVTKTVALSGRSVLAGDLSGLRRTLIDLPRRTAGNAAACPTVLTPADTRDYLLGLSYGEATLWVSAPGYRCAGSTNGSFTTRRNIAGDAEASYAARKWVGR